MVFLFDIDGVLNKSPYFTEKYIQQFGLESDAFEDFFSTEFPATLTNKEDLTLILPKHFAKWKWNQSVKEFIDYWFQNDTKLDTELLLLIRHFRRLGVKIGLASQQDKFRKEYLLNIIGLKDEFDCFYFSCDLGFLKSDGRFFETITNKEPQPIFFWDDTESVVEKAIHCGWKAYLYRDNQRLQREIENIIANNEF